MSLPFDLQVLSQHVPFVDAKGAPSGLGMRWIQAVVEAFTNQDTSLARIITYAPSLTPASVAANTSAEETFAVSGLTTDDVVIVNGPAPTAGTGLVAARVSAADELALTFANFTGGALTPAAGVYPVVAYRS